MPETPLLTLGMDPPESWLVEAVKTPYDLDNIYLEEVESGVPANFELEYLLLEGTCESLVCLVLRGRGCFNLKSNNWCVCVCVCVCV